MKFMNLRNVSKTVMVCVVFSLTACSSSDDANDNNNSSNSTAEQTANIVENGNWRITYFYDNNQDETNNFSGYSFSFNQDGSLTAVKGSSTINGSWSVSDGSSSSGDDDDFNIAFVSPPDFEDLTDDWDIISATNTKIELIDISGGNGGTDYLTFEKE